MIDLRLGNCLSILPTLDAGSVDAVVTDPPYGIAYQHSGGGSPVTGTSVDTLRRFTVPIVNDDKPFSPVPWLQWPCLMFGANHYAASLPTGGSWLVWDKACAGGPDDSFADAEFMWCSVKGIKRNVCRYLWKGVCQAGEKGRRKVHPTQKPVAVMLWCLKVIGLKEGDTVLDPYMGSGTTGVACVRAGLNFIGIELKEDSFAIAQKRIAAEQAKMSLFAGFDA
jgi:site-specific DNA-methyltransferase (adenine-specific)